jgi:hypothetical protein
MLLPSNKLVVRLVMIAISQDGSPRTSESLHTINGTPSLESLWAQLGKWAM